MRQVDVLVIGSGPAGQRAAIQSAKLGRSVAIVERTSMIGGVCINTGTIPSKALREAILQLTGVRGRFCHEPAPTVDNDITIQKLVSQCQHIIRAEQRVLLEHLQKNGIAVLWGNAFFEDPHTVRVAHATGSELVQAQAIILAVGTVPARPPHIPFDNRQVVDSDSFLRMPSLPRSLIIVGGGVIGTEYACMLNALGVRVILVEARPRLLDFVDEEISEALQYHMRSVDITLRLGEKVSEVRMLPNGLVEATLVSGKHLRAEALLYCIGRQGATATLGLERIGLETDARGRLQVDERFQTAIPHIYAVGDVIGFPSLASTSMEQGRVAACYACGEPVAPNCPLFPYGIYTIPEIAMVGKTEAQLTAEGVPYEVGVAHYREVARGQLLGDTSGMLKVLIHEQSREILGVHAIGTGATELIHIGQLAIAFHATVDYFLQAIFNYPTLAECYKLAALNGSNKLRLLQQDTVMLSAA
ncbi:MAG: Si-specific NAD(P)(+) transhydrogenase [Armatimonadota bacterium]